MARLEGVGAWFFTSLGAVLLGLSILVVPSNAFADPPFPPPEGTSCENYCAQYCSMPNSDPDCANGGAGCVYNCYAAQGANCTATDGCAKGCAANTQGTGC